MSRFWIALFFAGLVGLTACQPQEIVLEVTRIIETTPEKREVQVTSIVPQTVVAEATRVVTEELLIEVTRPPLGTEARPVPILFASSAVDPLVVDNRGAALTEALREVTGYQFVTTVLADEQAVIDQMCAAPAETIAFLTAQAYVLAKQQCSAQVGSVAVNRDGITWHTGMIVSRRDSGINSLADLDGKSWAVSDTNSMNNFRYFQALLQEEGVELGDIIEVTGDSAAMLAVFEGTVDVASAEFVPPIMPYEERLWEYGEDNPEPDRFLGIPPTRSPIGYVIVNGEPEFGGYRLRDARARIFDVAPEIYNSTQIVDLTAQIPNDTLAFGRDFPLGLARQVTTTLAEFAATEECNESLCSCVGDLRKGSQALDQTSTDRPKPLSQLSHPRQA